MLTQKSGIYQFEELTRVPPIGYAFFPLGYAVCQEHKAIAYDYPNSGERIVVGSKTLWLMPMLDEQGVAKPHCVVIKNEVGKNIGDITFLMDEIPEGHLSYTPTHKMTLRDMAFNIEQDSAWHISKYWRMRLDGADAPHIVITQGEVRNDLGDDDLGLFGVKDGARMTIFTMDDKLFEVACLFTLYLRTFYLPDIETFDKTVKTPKDAHRHKNHLERLSPYTGDIVGYIANECKIPHQVLEVCF